MPRPKGGLGRGLSTLLAATDAEPARDSTSATPRNPVLFVPIGDIAVNPRQPRQRIDPEQLQHLSDSIREHGVLQPLIVCHAGAGLETRYQLIAGERRWRAASAAGLDTVPAILMEATPRQQLELAIVENLQRDDLDALEQAHAYHRLVHDFGLTQEEAATRVGKSRVTITNSLRLLQATREVQDALAAGAISEGHARALLGAADAPAQRRALAVVLKRGLTVRQTEALARATAIKPRTRADAADSERAEVEQTLSRALGTRVRLQGARDKGKLVIEYYSDEQLDGLYQMLTR